MEQFQKRLALELTPINSALQANLSLLPAPCRPVAEHIFLAGGKRLRPLLTVLFARIFGYDRPDIYSLASSMEFLHAATLLHDDILDQASTRRAQPAAHHIFGITQTILAGDALLAAGNAIVAAFASGQLTLAYSRATMETAAGEILEMNSLGKPDLSHEQYLQIARGKTACLIAQACLLGAIRGGACGSQLEACAEFGDNLGLAFQLVDDALDFAPASQTGKPSGGDLREGKMTPPLRLYRESLSQSGQAEFDAAFSCHGFTDPEALAPQIRPFARASLAYADTHISKALACLDQLPDCCELAVLREMAIYVLNRTK